MTPELFAALFATIVSAGIAVRQTREARRLKLLDRELNAEDLLTKYREPLAAAAFDLQSRCWNIVSNDFFGKFGSKHDRFPDARMTTLFRFAQYFGWVEILRGEIQFLSFPEEQDTKNVSKLLSEIGARLASSDDNQSLMMWVDEQRAIGERMIVEHPNGPRCMGYATFCDRYEDCFAKLFARVIDDLTEEASMHRLRAAQHTLCDLVRALDKQSLRYDDKAIGRA